MKCAFVFAWTRFEAQGARFTVFGFWLRPILFGLTNLALSRSKVDEVPHHVQVSEFMVYGLRVVVYGLWVMGYGLWFMVYGYGLLLMSYGVWCMVYSV